MTLLDNFLSMSGGVRALPQKQGENGVVPHAVHVPGSGKPNPGLVRCIQILSKNVVDPLPIDLARTAMSEIMQGTAAPSQISAFLVGLAIHGAAPEVSLRAILVHGPITHMTRSARPICERAGHF